jgi:hypothetical protein
MDNVVEMLEITPRVDLKIIKETLTRMGVANKKEKIIFPSCYFYANEDKFYIVHFKQLFALTRPDGYNNMSEQDFIRRNAIAFCMKNWDLIDVAAESIEPHDVRIFVLPFGEKTHWSIKHKFNLAVLETETEE